MSMPNFKKPLTTAELHDIGDRNRGNPDVIELLWEIKRLRAHVVRADQLAHSITSAGGGTALILDALRSEFKDEPVLTERPDPWETKEPGDDD